MCVLQRCEGSTGGSLLSVKSLHTETEMFCCHRAEQKEQQQQQQREEVEKGVEVEEEEEERRLPCDWQLRQPLTNWPAGSR